VIGLERNGLNKKLDNRLNMTVSTIWARLSPASPWLYPIFKPGWKLTRALSLQRLKTVVETGLMRAQATRLYRSVIRLLVPAVEIAEANEADMRQIYSWFKPGQIAPGHQKIKITCFVARRNSKVLGYVDLVRRSKDFEPHEGYWLSSLIVRTPYRGLGLGEQLTRKVIETSKKEGARTLSILVFVHNDRAQHLYHKCGFERMINPALERQFDDEEKTAGYRRIAMSLDLSR
jgi:ribosomal protein S18 acetylase RimI-like enzyme